MSKKNNILQRIIFTVYLLVLFIGVAQSQEKTTIGILPFSYNSALSYNDVFTIQEAVLNAFVKVQKFNIVDRGNWQGLQTERSLQNTQDFINTSAIKKGMSLGAKYLISGHLSAILVTPMVLTDFNNMQHFYSSVKISLQLKIISVESTQIIASEVMDVYGGDAYNETTQELAYGRAILNIEPNIRDFIRRNFDKSQFVIVNVEKSDRKKRPVTVLINGGLNDGLAYGHTLTIVETTTLTVEGKTVQRKKNIGLLRIMKIEDNNFSIGTITSGKDEVKKSMDIGKKLFAMFK